MTRLSIATTCAVLTAGLAAQNYTVFPSDHTGTAGPVTNPGSTYSTYFPFSYGIARQMIVYAAWDVRIPNGRTIQKIGFPRNETSNSTGHPVLVKVSMGQTTLSLDNVTGNFAQNYSTTPVVVYGGTGPGGSKVFALPDLGGAAGADTVWLDLDTPFVYDNTKNLVVEFQVFGNQNSNAAWGYYLDGASFITERRGFGAACATGGGASPDLYTVEGSTVIGTNWAMYLRNGPASAATGLLVGLASHEPGIPLDAAGMTGCFLHIDSLWAGSYSTNSSGNLNFSFPIPMSRDLFGGRLYAQAIMQDFFANSLGWISSNGDEVKLGVHPQAVMIRGARGDATVATGSIRRNWGQVTIFDHN